MSAVDSPEQGLRLLSPEPYGAIRTRAEEQQGVADTIPILRRVFTTTPAISFEALEDHFRDIIDPRLMRMGLWRLYQNGEVTLTDDLRGWKRLPTKK